MKFKLMAVLICSGLQLQCSKSEPKAEHKVSYIAGTEDGTPPSTKIIGKDNPEVINVAERINFEFLKLSKNEFRPGEPIDISVNIELEDPTSAWSLFITKNKDEITDSVAIFKAQPISLTKVTWDSSFIGPGTYYLAAIVETGERHKLFLNPIGINISGNAFERPAEPVKIVITSPSTKTIYSPSEQVPIQFETLTSQPEGSTIQPQISIDRGATWQDIGAAMPLESASFNYTMPTSTTADLQLRLKLTEKSGALQYISQDDFFGTSETKVIGLDQIKPILEANCISCHRGNNANAGVRLDRDRDLQGLKRRILASLSPSSPNPMPPSGALTPTERTTFKFWEWFE